MSEDDRDEDKKTESPKGDAGKAEAGKPVPPPPVRPAGPESMRDPPRKWDEVDEEFGRILPGKRSAVHLLIRRTR